MHIRTLGQGLQVSAVGIGAMGMSQSYGPNPGSREEMIAVLRSFGIPARYVSGYIHRPNKESQSHAWCEAWIAGAGWIGIDPTNDQLVDDRFVKVAIGRDFTAVNQAGETVRLSQLKGKVWLVAEFFAVCPHCAMRNGAELRAIYDEFKNHPDFQIVCISVDPQTDTVQKLKDYASALGADTSDRWFLNGGDEKAASVQLRSL